MFWRKLAVMLLLLAPLVPCAHAQRDWEITPFYGARFGGRIDVNTTNVNYLTIRNTYNFGADVNFSLWRENFMPEFMWNRQKTELNAPFDGSIVPISSTNVDMYQFNANYLFRSSDSKFRPFVVAGAGFTRFGNIQSLLGFGTKLSYNVGGGVRYYFRDHWGVRLEARWSPTHITDVLAERCNPFFGFCGGAEAANLAEQEQVNIGIIYRFTRRFPF